MLNEKRVKHMVKLAFYESKEGAEEIRISSQSKRRYIMENTIEAIFWMTIAYVILAIFVYKAFAEVILQNITKQESFLILGVFAIGYVSLMGFYVIKTRHYYKKKHAKAHYNVKEFRKDLAELEKMYEEESAHE